MADDDDTIRQRVIIEGADGAAAELEKLGDEGAAALDKIKAAGGGDLGKGLRNISPEIAKIQDSFIEAEIAAKKLGTTTKNTSKSVKGLGDTTSPLGDVAKDMGKTTAEAVKLDLSARNLAKTFRGLGRVTNIGGLSVLGRTFRAVASNAELIGPAIIGGLGLIAGFAAKATQPFQDLAFAAGQLPEVFQKTSQSATAVGGDVEKFAQSLAKIPQAISQTAQQEAGLKSATDGVRQAIDKGTVSYFAQVDALQNINRSYETFRLQVALGIDPVSGLRDQINTLNESYKEGTITKTAYDKQSSKLSAQLTLAARQQAIEEENLQKQIRDANKAMVDADEASREQVKTAREQKKQLEESANAYVKLGISAAQLKSLKPDETFKLIADKLAPMEQGFKRNQLAVELLGENARVFINALDKGSGSIQKFIEEGQRIAPAFTPAENVIGDNMVTAIGKLQSSLLAIKDAFGLAIAPEFTDFFNQLLELFVQARPVIAEFGRILGPVLKPFLDGFVVVLKLIGAGLTLVIGLLNQVSTALNSAFGTNLTGLQLFAALLAGILVVFGGWVPLILLAAASISKLVTELAKIDFKKKFDDALLSVQNFATTLVQPFVDFWTYVQGLFNQGVTFISDTFNTGISFVTGLWESFKSYLAGWVSSVVSFFQPLVDMINKIAAFFASGQTTQQQSGPGFAGGGSVKGPGTSTSDSILAWLSNNEFVVKARAVAKYGVGFLNALNEGKLNLSQLSGFKLGGLVDGFSPKMGPFNIPKFAEGGPVVPGSGLKPVSISFEGTKFNAMMTDTAISQLSKKSIRARASRAGRSPSWVGG